MPVGIVVYDATGKVHQFNKHFTQLFGYTIDDIKSIEEWFPTVYPDEDYRNKVSKQWFAEIENYQITGLFNPIEAKVKCKDGSYREIELSFEAINNTYLTTFVDITERKKQEYELKHFKKFNTNLLNSLPGIYFLYETNSTDAKMVGWNKNHETILGYSSEELKNKSPFTFFTGSAIQKIMKAFDKLTKEGEVFVEAAINFKYRTWAINCL